VPRNVSMGAHTSLPAQMPALQHILQHIYKSSDGSGAEEQQSKHGSSSSSSDDALIAELGRLQLLIWSSELS
jgi:hypothetical protein